MKARLYSRQKTLKGIDLSFDREITIGRGSQNKVVLDKKEVSKKHLRIFFDENRKCFFLEDFGSANGTHLDNIRVKGKEQLRHLHVISIAGLYDFIFQDIQLCKARHPGQKQTDPSPPLKEQSQTVVADGPFSLPPKLGKPQEKSRPDQPQTLVGEGSFVLPPELKKAVPDLSKTVIGEDPFVLPSQLGKTQGKSIPDQPETVVGAAHFVLPPELGKPEEEVVVEEAKTVFSEKSSDKMQRETGRDQTEIDLPDGLIKTIRFDKVEDSLAPKDPPLRQRFFIEIWIDGTRTQQFALKEGENVIGRKAPAHIIIEKIEVSRRHAVLTLKDGSVYLKDAGSKNKTFVDGKEIIETLEIQPSHELRFGVIEARLVSA